MNNIEIIYDMENKDNMKAKSDVTNEGQSRNYA